MENGLTILDSIRENFPTKDMDIRAYSPLVLAFIGDSVYELIIRTLEVEWMNCPVNSLHKKKVTYFKAEAQAKMVDGIMDMLSEEEKSVYRRGKNAKTNTASKGGTLAEYHRATGFEALIGYLYLKNDTNRLMEVVKASLDVLRGDKALWD